MRNVIISHTFKYIFIKNKKVAGTSVEVYLNKYRGDNDIFTPISPKVQGHVAQNYRGLYKPFNYLKYKKYSPQAFKRLFIDRLKFWNHISASQIRERIDEEIWEDYYKFCIERNP